MSPASPPVDGSDDDTSSPLRSFDRKAVEKTGRRFTKEFPPLRKSVIEGTSSILNPKSRADAHESEAGNSDDGRQGEGAVAGGSGKDSGRSHSGRGKHPTTTATLIKWYNLQLRKQPVLTKSVTSAVISSLGDLCAQIMGGKRYQARQTIKFAIWGFGCVGPLTHLWYKTLEKAVPRTPKSNDAVIITQKLLLDRLVFATFFQTLFVLVCKALDRVLYQTPFTTSDLRERTWPMLKNNWWFWTFPQFLNLKYVPVTYRPLFANGLAFVWTIYLSLKSRPAPKAITK